MSKEATAVILVPSTIQPAMIAAGTTVPAVDTDAGEVAYNAATTYPAGTQRVNFAGGLYTALSNNTGVAPSDVKSWRKTGPSNRLAPFDDKLSTQARRKGSLTYVLRPGFFTGLSLYGLQGETLSITVRDKPGGAVIYSFTGDLWEQARGLFEYLFMPLRALTKWQHQGLDLYPDPELTLTVSNADPQQEVAVGEIICGHWQTLVGTGDFGGVEYGGDAEIKTYTYFQENDDGSVEITPRSAGTNVSCSILVDATQANQAFELLQSVASRPVAFIASGLPRYDYLNTYGLVSASVSPQTWATASINLKVRGYI